MFPSTSLFANIECPHKDKCGRGKLCMFKHSPVQRQKKPEVPPKRAAEIPAQPEKPKQAEKSGKIEQPREPEPPGPVEHAQHTEQQPQQAKVSQDLNKGDPVLVDQTPDSTTSSEPLQSQTTPPEITPDETLDWRQLTLNYDPEGPAYDSACETVPTIPQLRAVVGERVGYARRQKSLGILFQKYLELCDPQTLKNSPWMPAQQAVTSEQSVYVNGGAGTYTSNLLACMRDLKAQEKSQ